MIYTKTDFYTACTKNTYKSGSTECSNCPLNSETTGPGSSRSDCTCKSGFTGPAGGPCQGKTNLNISLNGRLKKKNCIALMTEREKVEEIRQFIDLNDATRYILNSNVHFVF